MKRYKIKPKNLNTPEIDEPEVYLDILKQIDDGLCTDLEEENGHVWKVKAYLEGKTEGIEVYTKYGKYLGTAYRFHDCMMDNYYKNLLFSMVQQALMDYRHCVQKMRKIYSNPATKYFIDKHSFATSMSGRFNDFKVEAMDILHWLKTDPWARKFYASAIDHLIVRIDEESDVDYRWFVKWVPEDEEERYYRTIHPLKEYSKKMIVYGNH